MFKDGSKRPTWPLGSRCANHQENIKNFVGIKRSRICLTTRCPHSEGSDTERILKRPQHLLITCWPSLQTHLLDIYAWGTRLCRRMHETDLLHFMDGLYGYAMAITRNRAEAEDLVQETYLRAIPRMGSLRVESNVKSWLFTILRNIYLNQLRKRRTAPSVLEMDADEHNANIVVETSKDPLARYVSKTEREWVMEALQQLPPGFREIVMLREYEDLTYQEIAGILKCPVGTVMSRLARARSRLRTLLAAEGRPLCPKRKNS
jgi:RNA polymerase sigma-70 factor, ECF subfamily